MFIFCRCCQFSKCLYQITHSSAIYENCSDSLSLPTLVFCLLFLTILVDVFYGDFNLWFPDDQWGWTHLWRFSGQLVFAFVFSTVLPNFLLGSLRFLLIFRSSLYISDRNLFAGYKYSLSLRVFPFYSFLFVYSRTEILNFI